MDPQPFGDDSVIAAKSLLPEAISQHRHSLLSRIVIPFIESAASYWGDHQNGKEIASYQLPLDRGRRARVILY